MIERLDPEEYFHEQDNYVFNKELQGKTNNFSESKEQKLQRLLETRKKIAAAIKQEIKFNKPILKQNGKPVFFPKTINVIQGKAGVHKSRLAETICSALLKKSTCSNKLLDFTANADCAYTVIYVDTERNLSDQLPYALQQIMKKAGYNIQENLSHFDYISLLEFEREDRFEMLDLFLEYVRKNYNTHIFIVLDVITDCVFNFNDSKDSMKLIDMMNKSINRFDVTFLCLIHENPGSNDKARGHLGTEIMNKSSTVIQVGFEKDSEKDALDLIKISFLKCRSSKKHDPFYVQYSETEQGLITASQEAISDAMNRKKLKAGITDVVEILSKRLTEPISRTELLLMLSQELNCKERTLEDRLKEIFETSVQIKDSQGNVCILKKDNQKKELFYFLEPIGQTELNL